MDQRPLEKVYFSAHNDGPVKRDLWTSGMHENPQAAALDFINSLKDENHPEKANRLKALSNGCLKGSLRIEAWFKDKQRNAYTLSNFGPRYSVAIWVIEDDPTKLPGSNGTYETVNTHKF